MATCRGGERDEGSGGDRRGRRAHPSDFGGEVGGCWGGVVRVWWGPARRGRRRSPGGEGEGGGSGGAGGHMPLTLEGSCL